MWSEEEMLKEAKKLAWDERLLHKNWKVRNEANVDLASLCDSITNPKDQRLREFGPLFRKTVADSNAHVQEKALDALIAFLRAADADSRSFAKEVCDAIAAKCLNGPPKTVKKSQAAFLLWIELEATDVFLDTMEKAVKNNVSKAVVPVVDVMFQALSEFGSKIVPPERVLKMLPQLFDHRDQNVRASSKGLTLELCRWIGKEPVKSILFGKMRDSMKNELEAELVNVRGNARPPRKIRTEQDKEPEATASEVACCGHSQESPDDVKGQLANGNISSLEGASAVPKKLATGGLDRLAREYIRGKITPALLKDLGSTDWKVRLESIEAINKILQEANKPVLPTGTLELFAALRGRLNGRNKNLVMVTLCALGRVAQAMGPAVEKASKELIDFCKDTGLHSSAAANGNATIKLIGSLCRYVGPDLKPTLLGAIDAEYEQDPFESVKGLKFVNDELTRLTSDPEGRSMDYIAKDADWLVSCLANKLSKTFDISLTEAPSLSCRYVLNALMLLFQNKEVALAIKESTLDSVITELLLLLLDERVPRMDRGSQILKASNVLMLKILNNADSTTSFVVLSKLLRPLDPSKWPSPASAFTCTVRNEKFSDLVVKCLIKLTKDLPSKMYEVDLGRIQESMTDEIRRRAGAGGGPDDKPLRMVKTVLRVAKIQRTARMMVDLSMVSVPIHPVVPSSF